MGAKVVIHNPQEMPFPNEQGYFAAPGRAVDFVVTRVRNNVANEKGKSKSKRQRTKFRLITWPISERLHSNARAVRRVRRPAIAGQARPALLLQRHLYNRGKLGQMATSISVLGLPAIGLPAENCESLRLRRLTIPNPNGRRPEERRILRPNRFRAM